MVTVFADTIFMSEPIEAPINYKLSLRARSVVITEDIPMNMTRKQFFDPNLEFDQPVESWAKVQEVVTHIGNTIWYCSTYRQSCHPNQGHIVLLLDQVLTVVRQTDGLFCSKSSCALAH